MNTIYLSSLASPRLASAKSDLPEARERVKMTFEVIWDGVFDGRMDDKDPVIKSYSVDSSDPSDLSEP